MNRETIWMLKKQAQYIRDTFPPYYMFGDNEAACWMSDRLDEMTLLIFNLEEL
jgi:hypothetical protein